MDGGSIAPAGGGSLGIFSVRGVVWRQRGETRKDRGGR